MTTSEMVTALREMTTMETATPDSVQVKKSFLREVADKLEDMDERIAIMAESEAEEQDFGFDFPED